MLINNINDMKPYLPSVMMKTDDSSCLDDAVRVADRYVRDSLTGEAVYRQCEQEPESERAEMVKRVVALAAFLPVMADLDLALTDAGFVVVQDQQMVPASRQRVEKLERSLRIRLRSYTMLLIDELRADREWQSSEAARTVCRGFVATWDELLSGGLFDPSAIGDYDKVSTIRRQCAAVLDGKITSWIPETVLAELEEKYIQQNLSTEGTAVVALLRMAVLTAAAGRDGMEGYVIRARNRMLASPDEFPGMQSLAPAEQNNDSPVVNML